MGYLNDSFATALVLIAELDADLVSAVSTSLSVSLASVAIAALFGLPLGLIIGQASFRGRRLVLMLINTLMAMPTVVVGLVVYGLLSRQGPMGDLGLLFSPTAIIIGQSLLAVPIVAHYVIVAVEGADPRIIPTALTLGATKLQSFRELLIELRFGIVAALIAGFGRVIAEVGVAMMLGGNIRGYTRTMTTAIAMETGKGEFALGLALGMVLMILAFVVNLFLHYFQER